LLLKDDIVVERPGIVNYALALPQAPGLGVALDEDKLSHYSRKH